MTRLLKGATVLNVFTGMTERADILIEGETIIGVGEYKDADVVEDYSGKILCPGLIDGHIHIESTMMTPCEFAKAALLHGTTSIVADPHEIANVCGKAGIEYMYKASEGIPLNVYIMIPSCVPASKFDESGACLESNNIKKFYDYKRVIGLAEMMNYPGVIFGDKSVDLKIKDALERGKHIDGHAPLVSGKDLDKYISKSISTDHECTSFLEASEKIRKGQWVMIRYGSAAKDLLQLSELFDEPWCKRCLLVSDDKHPHELLYEGYIDASIRKAFEMGKNPIVAIQMATIQAATCFGLKYVGAIAPGYRADIIVMSSLEALDISDVYSKGKKVVENNKVCEIIPPVIDKGILKSVYNSFKLKALTEKDFNIQNQSGKCRVIKTIPNRILTGEVIEKIDFETNNGIDIERDILKIAVIERHKNTGHKGVGYISGIGLKKGAIASSVSHDSHNIIVVGTNDADMAFAANRIIALGGGYVAVENKNVLAEIALPVAGLMSEKSVQELSEQNSKLQSSISSLGVENNHSVLMTMSFMSLPVIPDIKMTTRGLVDVNKQMFVPLFEND